MKLKDRFVFKEINDADERVVKMVIEAITESFEVLPMVRQELIEYLKNGNEKFSIITVNFLAKASNWLKNLYFIKCHELGIEVSDFNTENEMHYNERFVELLDFIMMSLNSTSMYYYIGSPEQYWPSIKLYSTNGIIFYTSKDRMFDIVKIQIPNWNFKRDFQIILRICEIAGLKHCESHKDENGYCETISFIK